MQPLTWVDGIKPNGCYYASLSGSLVSVNIWGYLSGVEIVIASAGKTVRLPATTTLAVAKRKALRMYLDTLKKETEMAAAITLHDGLRSIKSIEEALTNAAEAVVDHDAEKPITITQESINGPLGATLVAEDESGQKYAITVTPIDG